MEVMRESSGSATPPVSVTEYLEFLAAEGIAEQNFPEIQPIMQKRIWDRIGKSPGPQQLEKTIEQLRKEDNRFNMEGGSWTNDISWVRGYSDVLGPLEKVSALFAEKTANADKSEHRYRNALFHLLTTQTSCYRYWGAGLWTDYARELIRRTNAILSADF
jgi:hypothetical protein